MIRNELNNKESDHSRPIKSERTHLFVVISCSGQWGWLRMVLLKGRVGNMVLDKNTMSLHILIYSFIDSLFYFSFLFLFLSHDFLIDSALFDLPLSFLCLEYYFHDLYISYSQFFIHFVVLC